ncbi:MAG: M81 family metallopeptidase, partial [Thermomicrobiaceae bacterium]|nr:M81 family metallopeptidase [Thermomicrobiaceae bacterium]
MRLAIGALPHEANTFSRVPTTLEDIQRAGLHEGEDVLDAVRGTGTPLGGVIDAADDLGLTLLPTVALTPVAGGPLAGGLLDALADRLSARLRG